MDKKLDFYDYGGNDMFDVMKNKITLAVTKNDVGVFFQLDNNRDHVSIHFTMDEYDQLMQRLLKLQN